MFLSNASTCRPIAMSCLIIMLIIFGGMAYTQLGKDTMPNIEVPYVSIVTVVPGASPTEIEVNVARKIEDSVSGIDGLKTVNSTCMDNLCMTLLEFQLNVDVDVAAADVREKVDLIINDLPAEAEKPKIKKFDPNSKAVVTMMAVGDLPIDEIYDYIDDKLSAKFSTIAGVAEVEVTGCEEMEFHITLDPEKLAGFGLNAYHVVQKINAANVKVPAGRIKEADKELTVTFDAEIKSVDDAKTVEIGKYQGRRIYLRDVATVEMRSKENRTAAFYNGRQGISIKIIKKGEANALDVVQAARKIYDRVVSDGTLPGGLKLVWFLDDGAYIVSNVDDAWSSVYLGMAMTALILLLFLQDVRSTFIVAISMPSSIIITFAVIKMFGYTFNNMTLLAIGTSVGTLVANSIVVLENIFKRIQSGENTVTAADWGTAEVAAPVFASAATNIVVFIPIALMSSLVGRFFTSFAVTMTVATLISLFISFSLTPILALCLAKPRETRRKRIRFFSAFADRFNAYYLDVENFYMRGIGNVIRRPWRTVAYSLVLFLLTMIFIAPRVGGSFFPETDRGEVIVKLEFPTYYNLDATVARTRKIEERILKMPHVLQTAVSIGKVRGSIGQASEGVHLAEIHVKLTGKKERGATIDDIRQMMRNTLAEEVDLLPAVNIPTTVGGASAMIEVEISGTELPVLEQTVKRITAAIARQRTAAGESVATDLDTSARAAREELKIKPERAVIQDMNLNANTLGMLLRANIEGLKVGTYKRGDRTFDIRVKIEECEGREQIPEFTVASKEGKPLQLKNIADIENSELPIQINRADKSRIAKIYGNPAPGMALTELVKRINTEGKKELPPGYQIRFTGQVDKMNEAIGEFVTALILAAIMTYLLIAATMESWSMPFIIIFTLPLALIGMELALFLSGLTLSMMGLLGAVMLIGIIVNNAILIMDEVAVQRKNGLEPPEAVTVACRSKLRPIVMTSIAAVIGIIPMAFGTGLGSELRQSAGMGIVGGLISSTLLSVYVIPALYLLFQPRRKQP